MEIEPDEEFGIRRNKKRTIQEISESQGSVVEIVEKPVESASKPKRRKLNRLADEEDKPEAQG